MRLNRALAATAIGEGVAEPLAIDTIAAARGIYEVVNDNMANAASVYAAEQGVDLRDFTLLAFGGAAPTRARCSPRVSRIGQVPHSLGGSLLSALSCSGFAGVVRLRLRLHARARPSRLEQRRCPFPLCGGRRPPASRRSRHPPRHHRQLLGCMRYVSQRYEVNVALPGGGLSPGCSDPSTRPLRGLPAALRPDPRGSG